MRGPRGCGPEGWGPEILARFFPSPAHIFILFFSLWGIFSSLVFAFRLSCGSPRRPAGATMEFPEMFQVPSLKFEPRLQSSNFELRSWNFEVWLRNLA